MPKMNDRPAASISFWFASLTIPASATDRDVGELVGGHERFDDRQHRLGLGLVPFKGADHEREPVLVGQQVGVDQGRGARLAAGPYLLDAKAHSLGVLERSGWPPRRCCSNPGAPQDDRWRCQLE